MATATEEYAELITGSTTEYLDSVRSCTALLPATLLRYGEPEFHQTSIRLGESESMRDARLRELRELVGDADPNYTDVYLRTPDVMELYALLDEVPNAAEQFVRDLARSTGRSTLPRTPATTSCTCPARRTEPGIVWQGRARLPKPVSWLRTTTPGPFVWVFEGLSERSSFPEQ